MVRTFIFFEGLPHNLQNEELSLPPLPACLLSYCPSDSYSQRAAVRAALAQDPPWLTQYISMALPMLSSQDNEVTYLVPWTHLQKPPKEGGKPRPQHAKFMRLH